VNKKVSLLTAMLVVIASLSIGALVTYRQAGGDLIWVDRAVEPGSVFFVSSGAGTDYASCGRAPTRPCATIDYAVGLCTDDKGDVIYVMPGHNEGLGSTGHIDFDVAGITVVGLGNGTNRPRIDYDNAAGSVTIGADNVTLKNLTFLPSVTAVLIGVDVEAGADFTTLVGCEFLPGEDGSGVDEFIKDVQVEGTANDFKMIGCTSRGQVGAAQQTYSVYLGNAGTVARPVIKDNIFWGNYSTAVIGDGSTAITGAVITGNTWTNATATIAPIALETASTSDVWGNERDIGTTFYTTTTVAAGASVATGGLALTGAAAGTLELMDVTIQVGATALASANGTAALELYTDNSKGTDQFMHIIQTSLTAQDTVDLRTYTFVQSGNTITKSVYGRTTRLESGKKIYVRADTQTFNAGGTFIVNLYWKRLSAGASIASR
jgi:hypothetical protein